MDYLNIIEPAGRSQREILNELKELELEVKKSRKN